MTRVILHGSTADRAPCPDDGKRPRRGGGGGGLFNRKRYHVLSVRFTTTVRPTRISTTSPTTDVFGFFVVVVSCGHRSEIADVMAQSNYYPTRASGKISDKTIVFMISQKCVSPYCFVTVDYNYSVYRPILVRSNRFRSDSEVCLSFTFHMRYAFKVNNINNKYVIFLNGTYLNVKI